jgi:hypothetical protein
MVRVRVRVRVRVAVYAAVAFSVWTEFTVPTGTRGRQARGSERNAIDPTRGSGPDGENVPFNGIFECKCMCRIRHTVHHHTMLTLTQQNP